MQMLVYSVFMILRTQLVGQHTFLFLFLFLEILNDDAVFSVFTVLKFCIVFIHVDILII